VGRPALSDGEHHLKGTRPTRAASSRDSEILPGKPRCPKHLSPDARREFRRVLRLLMTRGYLSEGDSTILAVYARCYERWLQAEAHVDAHGMMMPVPVFNRNGEQTGTREKINPNYIAAADRRKELVTLSKTLGITPVDKDRPKLPKQPEKEVVDEVEHFFSGPRVVPFVTETHDEAQQNEGDEE
jgi:P27 family predicted phage terminase small subunit